MLKNYLTIAFRTLTKNKSYALINIVGLSIGITFLALIFFFIEGELTFDSFHSKSDRIYRIVERDNSDPENEELYGQTSPGVALAMKEDIPGIEAQTRIFKPGGHIDITWDGKKTHERSYIIAEENFFEVFDFEFVKGDPGSALQNNNSIVVTESLAKRFFGDQDPMGQTMKWENFAPSKVTGVLKDLPENSHLQFNIMFSRNTEFTEDWGPYLISWKNYGAYSYLLLDENSDPKSVEAAFPALYEKYIPEKLGERSFFLQPLQDIYLDSDGIRYGIEDRHGNRFYINLFIGISIFLLLMVSINYVNLSTAKSLHRAKEIGLRKVSGATKPQLMIQFFMEAILLSLVSFVVAVFLIEVLLPHFNEIALKNFEINGDNFFSRIGMIFLVTTVLGLASGIYPSVVLARIKPVDNLKGLFRKNSFKIRSTLLIVQFGIGIIMLVGTMVIHRQMSFINEKNLGFDKEDMLVVDINNRNVRNNFELIKELMSKVPGVEAVASSSRVPGEWKWIADVDLKNGPGAQDSTNAFYMCFDEDMPETYDLEFVAGGNFSGNISVDSSKIILNESAVRAMQLEDPIGKTISLSRDRGEFQVIGVMKDFHFQSLHSEILPLAIGSWVNPITAVDYFSVRLSTSDFDKTLAGLTEIHDQFDKTTPIEYHFLDQQIDLFYENDHRVGNLFGIGAILMLVIGGIGLFGITSYMLDRRKKEIGIRKVLGSSVVQLVLLLYRTYGKQVLIAFIFSAPLGYIFANQWTSEFTNREEVSPFLFLYSGVVVALFTMLIVSYKVVDTARLNPVEVLKDE